MNWDDFYKTNDCAWGNEPTHLAKSVIKHMTSGDILDLGCGEGRDSIALAKHGLHVTAVDISPLAIERVTLRAEQEHVEIQAVCADISTYKITGEYDCIFSFATLFFLKKETALRIIKDIKTHTKQGGINAIHVFTTEHAEGRFSKLDLFKPGELENQYSDWTVLEKRSYLGKTKAGTTQSSDIILARKK